MTETSSLAPPDPSPPPTQPEPPPEPQAPESRAMSASEPPPPSQPPRRDTTFDGPADSVLPLLARSALALMLASASVMLAVAQATADWTPGFVTSNLLTTKIRNRLLIVLAAGIVTGLGATATLLVGWRARATWPQRLERLSRAARLAAPLMLAALLPGLLRGAYTDPLFAALLIGVLVLVGEPLWRLHFGVYAEVVVPPRPLRWSMGKLRALWARVPVPVRRHLPWVLVGLAAASYFAYASFFAIRNHHRFATYTWDLGQIDNQFYNALHGRPFRSTPLIRGESWSELRNHAEFTLFALLPFYALHPAASTLLILQALLLASGGVAIYRLAARRLPRAVAFTLAACYWLYPPLHGAQFFDIHFQPLAGAFVLWALDFFDTRRMWLFWLFFVLAIGCREDIPVGTAVFGLFLLITGHRAKQGALILVISLAYFVTMRFVVMPSMGQWGFAEHYKDLFPENDRSFAGVIKTLLTNPVFALKTLINAEKLRYFLQIAAPLAFLPLRRMHLALSVLPGAYFTLLTTQYGPTLDIAYQYSGYFIAYMFPAAALMLAAYGREVAGVCRRRAAVATLILATATATAQWGAIPPRKNFRAAYAIMSFAPLTAEEKQRYRDLKELAAMVPKNAILAATDRELPHVSNRLDCWNFSVGFEGADYLLVTTHHPIPPETEQLQKAMHAGYQTVATRPGLLLLKRPGA